MADVDRHVLVYSIGMVWQLTGLTDGQIRYCEKLGLIMPACTTGYQKRYSPLEVERLEGVYFRSAQLDKSCLRAQLPQPTRQPPPRGAGVTDLVRQQEQVRLSAVYLSVNRCQRDNWRNNGMGAVIGAVRRKEREHVRCSNILRLMFSV
ncbi:MAG: MerR family transcriptional regulator [bacterium]